MKRLLRRCCGLDVHKASVTACVRVPRRGGGRVEHVAEFSTMTPDLLALRDWLAGFGVTHVAMEATGVYWKPVWYLLEDEFELLLVNAAHVKQVPGRKTDISDAQWLCQLLEHGLLRGSFVPPKPIRELCDLTRYRKSLIRERQREANPLQKQLEDAGIKLGCVASDVLGASGRAMIEALVAGEADPAALAELARGRLRAKLPALRHALLGRFSGHHALLCSHILAHLDYLDEAISALSTEIEERTAPFAHQLELLCTIPGIKRRGAEVILAELGPDMSRFPTDRHAASWASLSPGNDSSAGKRRSGRTRKGDQWLRESLTECALAASRTRNTYLKAQYLRLRRRRGEKKAIIAVAHSLLVIAYHVLKTERPYHELGDDWFLRRDNPTALARRLTHQLERLGHRVTLEPLPTP
jgi:transposase